MDPEYWLNKWRENDIGFHEKSVNQDLVDYIHTLQLKTNDCVFVPLCGKSKDMIWLADQGFRVIGVELSQIACEEFFSEMAITPQITHSEKFTKYKHANIELYCGDIFDITASDLPPVQAVFDWKALIALAPDVRKKYVNHLISCFGTSIKILLLTRETNCDIKPPPYSVDEQEVKALYGANFVVSQLKHYSVPTDAIPKRLVKKGYLDMVEGVYLIKT